MHSKYIKKGQESTHNLLPLDFSTREYKNHPVSLYGILGGYRHNYRYEAPEGAGRDYLGSWPSKRDFTVASITGIVAIVKLFSEKYF